MGRKATLTLDQVLYIRASNRILKDLAHTMGASMMTVWKAKHSKPPYDTGIFAVELAPEITDLPRVIDETLQG